MNGALLALIVLGLFAAGYLFYSRFLSERIFRLRKEEPVPARQFEDGVDFVPTKMHVLWGHHYTSIAGAAPIVGPALAVIWGWVPAILWITLGTICMGAVHDFSSLVISLRHRGRSIGDIAGTVIEIRNNTFRAPQMPVAIRGVPQERCDVHHNWFLKHDVPERAVRASARTNVFDNVYGPTPKAAK